MTAADPSTAQPATPGLDLDAIDAALAHPLQNRPWRDIVRSLVAEVRRLRGELAEALNDVDDRDATIGTLRDDLNHQTGAAFDNQAEANRLRAELDAAPAAPTRYALPAEPPVGTELWDSYAVNWVRKGDLWYDTERRARPCSWTGLLVRGPLSSVPPAGTAVAVAIGEDGTAYLDDGTEVPAGEWEPAGTEGDHA